MRKFWTSVILILAVVSLLLPTTYCVTYKPQEVTHWISEERKIIFSNPSIQDVNTTIVDWGLTIPDGTQGIVCSEGDQCIDYGIAKVVVTDNGNCQTIDWISNDLSELKDCINLLGHWYGGGQQFTQPWPIEKNPRIETAFVTADMLSHVWWYGGVSERYWISSAGISVKVEDYIPLFLSIPDNDGDKTADQMCFSSRYETPFVAETSSSALCLTYSLCYANDVKEVYQSSFSTYFPFPEDIPDERMMTDPIWSTWAEYKTDVNATRVIQFAQDILDYGFNNSQVEIDDNWETCYGNAVFNPDRFPDPKGMVDQLHSMNFRVTLWIHPFINVECDSFTFADQQGYFIKNASGQTQLTNWWQGNNAGLIDPTNSEAVSWWNGRLITLQNDYGIDSFKFDAGETTWMPDDFTLSINKTLWPDGYTTAYADQVSYFGNLIEDRVAHGGQQHPFFVRMLDKNSYWTDQNGLTTLIPSMLHSGLLGYPFVLPDMVGGNSYTGKPSAELYIRWAQVNTFMPSIQFSLLPWEFEEESEPALEISRQVTSLHTEFAPLIIELGRNATLGQGPIARPTWWLCPTNEDCLLANQQFLLGDNVLVAPVVEKGAQFLEIVFPPGDWQFKGSGTLYRGPSKFVFGSIDIYSNMYFIKA